MITDISFESFVSREIQIYQARSAMHKFDVISRSGDWNILAKNFHNVSIIVVVSIKAFKSCNFEYISYMCHYLSPFAVRPRLLRHPKSLQTQRSW